MLSDLLECQTNYHHNFQVKVGIRTYYSGIPAFIQIGEHQFAEKRLIQLWISQMLVSWCVIYVFHNSLIDFATCRTSATNCARLYNLSLSDTVPPSDWAFGFSVTADSPVGFHL